MRKKAEEVLVEGLSHPDPRTAEICRNALIVLKTGKGTGKRPFRPRRRVGGKFDIKEIPGKGRESRERRPSPRGRRPDDHTSHRR